jgi:hypothetical protein
MPYTENVREIQAKVWYRNPEERGHSEDLGVEVRIILQ